MESRVNGRDATILLVEDNDGHADLVKFTFETQRLLTKIVRVKDGESALDYLFRRGNFSDPQTSPRPNLVLLDLRIPKTSGLDVLSQIKTNDALRQIPVVILSTSASEQDLSAAYERCANSYLVKPVEFSDLSEMLANLGKYWLNWNQLPDKSVPA